MNKLLAVYNTCGLKNEDTQRYLQSIDSIIAQECPDISVDVVISSCRNSSKCLSFINSFFRDKIRINSIEDIVPVNVTFNHTALKMRELCGPYDGYMYVDSGVSLDRKDVIYDLIQTFQQQCHISMVSADVDDDGGVAVDTGPLRDLGYDAGRGILGNGVVSVGSSVNLHCQIFSDEIMSFYGRILPDIFAGFCTESTLTFVAAALQTNWVHRTDIRVSHLTEMDGRSSGFNPSEWIATSGRKSYDHPFAINSYMDRFENQQAKSLGLGFEECRGVLVHDHSQYDENDHCINDGLKQYIKDNLYLTDEEFDYGSIRSKII